MRQDGRAKLGCASSAQGCAKAQMGRTRLRMCETDKRKVVACRWHDTMGWNLNMQIDRARLVVMWAMWRMHNMAKSSASKRVRGLKLGRGKTTLGRGIKDARLRKADADAAWRCDNGAHGTHLPRQLSRLALNEAYTGNCVLSCFAYDVGSELAALGGLAKACMAIGQVIRAGTKDPLRRCEGWMDEYLVVPRGKAVHVVGSPWFGVYRTDFGWGPSGRVELVSMNHDGEVVLVARKEEGVVQASVAVSAKQMEMFAEQFVGVGVTTRARVYGPVP